MAAHSCRLSDRMAKWVEYLSPILVDRWIQDYQFETWSSQADDFKKQICCFLARRSALVGQSKDRLDQCQDILMWLSEISGQCDGGLVSQWNITIKLTRWVPLQVDTSDMTIDVASMWNSNEQPTWPFSMVHRNLPNGNMTSKCRYWIVRCSHWSWDLACLQTGSKGFKVSSFIAQCR